VAEIVLFHSALGLRPAVVEAADRLRAAGHTVHAPDLFEGSAQFDSVGPAMAYVQQIGFPTLGARAAAAVAPLSPNLVYAGFSLGANFAARLAATRPGAMGALLFHGGPSPAQLRIEAWPATAPVQIHFAVSDPWRDNAAIASMSELVRASGADCAVFDYPGSAHLFSDTGLASDYDPTSAALMWERTLDLLTGVDAA
jgi:dienelactone hydrolase